jgi:hypothetical protein
MTKIAPEHLKGNAVVYIRQSSPYQVVNNLESKRLQYALVERGRQLGWTDVQVIDDDLGRSSTSGAARPGFEKLLEQVCKGNVARFCQSKPHALHVPGASGTHCSSFVVWLARLLSTKSVSTIHAIRMIEWYSA